MATAICFTVVIGLKAQFEDTINYENSHKRSKRGKPTKAKSPQTQCWRAFHYITLFNYIQKSGAGENRTPVQTYSSKAFYMFIVALIVGDIQEQHTPIYPLAGWS